MKTTKTIKLNNTERTILSLCKSNGGKATLHEMEAAFKNRARKAPKTWKYATKVKPEGRTKFRASLLARNGIRKPVRLGLLRKTKPGTYAITAAGVKAI